VFGARNRVGVRNCFRDALLGPSVPAVERASLGALRVGAERGRSMPDDVIAFIDFLGRQLVRLSRRLRRKMSPPEPDRPT
jgi:hypothetical protein